ncbi:Rv1733c family protein [Streptomyces scabiei]|uniref:Rv1733c family protein n=1 Tax=Streptomyces scabiei TaxID=1930 RepID=UPI00073EAD8B
MATAPCAKVRCWRWRRNPLRRLSDVIEAWIILAGWVMALVGGLYAGLAAADAIERSADRQRTERREVSAVLAEDAKGKVPARAAGDPRVWATVRWTAPDGSTRTGEARVSATSPAGDRVTVWIDKSGHLTAPPLTDGQARSHAAAGGLLVATGVGGIALAAVRVARFHLNQRRMEQWAVEWERVDTRWGRKTG